MLERLSTLSRRLNPMSLLLASVAFSGLIWLALPACVVVIDDDFWYLKSVVETYAHGRPWTTNYLAPYSAATSSLCALVFAVTGRMSWAVHGSLALAAALSFAGLAKLLASAGLTDWRRLALSWLTLSGPTVLFMSLMFTGVPMYWAMLWWCAWAWREGRWGPFTLAWAIAEANRQSALVWLALPGMQLALLALRQRRLTAEMKAPALVLGAAALWMLALKIGLNPTASRAAISGQSTQFGRLFNSDNTSLVAFAALAAGLGFGSLITRDSSRPWWLVAILASAGAMLAPLCLSTLDVTHSAYIDPMAIVYLRLVGAAAGLGLAFLRPQQLGWPALVAGLGAAALLMLYHARFDYHYIEVIAWGLIAALPPQGKPLARETDGSAAAPSAWLSERRWLSLVSGLLLLGIAGFHLRWYPKFKLDQHRVMAFNVLYEQALRSGKIQPHEIGLSTMGHVGWLLEDHFRSFPDVAPGNLTGFLSFCDSWDGKQGISLYSQFPKALRRYPDWLPQRNVKTLTSPNAVELVSTKMRVLGFWEAEFSLRRLPRQSPSPMRTRQIDYSTYRPNPFPISDAEWLAYCQKARE